jgi:S-adenosylmethionine:tRNA ribosyltransferase-isomerase
MSRIQFKADIPINAYSTFFLYSIFYHFPSPFPNSPVFVTLRRMRTDLFDYHLPEDRIAQEPMQPRDHSKLLILDRETGETKHRHFFNIVDELNAGDLLIANESKVFKARLEGRIKKLETRDQRPEISLPAMQAEVSEALRARDWNAEAVIEVFLLRPQNENNWISLAKPGKKLKIGSLIQFDEDVTAIVKEKRDEDGTVVLTFDKTSNKIIEWTDHAGNVPVPPYVKATQTNTSNYQTVYAKHVGSVAAPTAGFHFTPELIETLKNKGVQFATVTLHVGLGTFRPVKTDDLDDHIMHEEWVSVPLEVREAIKNTRINGHRAIAVGTTTVRALESGLDEGFTKIFIKPGYSFKWIDGLITNFHLPKSTLLVLISSFIGEKFEDSDKGRQIAIKTYEEAITHEYRFYSFGDAMLIR